MIVGGNHLDLKEEFRISFTGSVNNSAFSVNSQVGIPSGLLALVRLSFISFIKTSCLVTKVKICAKRKVIWQWREDDNMDERKALLIMLAS